MMFELAKLLCIRCGLADLTLYGLKNSSISLRVSLTQEAQVLRDHKSQLISLLLLLKRVSRVSEMVYEKSIVTCILVCKEEQLIS